MTSVGNIMAGNSIVDLASAITPNASAGNADFGQYIRKEVAAQSSVNAKDAGQTEVVSREQKVSVQKEEKVIADTNQMQTSDAAGEVTVTEEQVTSLNQKIKDAVQDALGIDEETMENVLAEMGIMPMALLQPENLQQFILLVDGGQEPTDLLMNETMMNDFRLVLDVLQSMDLSESVGIPMEKLLQQMQLVPETEIAAQILQTAEAGAVEMEAGMSAYTEQSEPVVVTVQQEEGSVNRGNGDNLQSMVNQETSTAVENTTGMDAQYTGSQNMADANASGQNESELPQQENVIQRDPASDFVVTGNIQQQVQMEATSEISAPQPTPQMVQIVEQIVEQIRVNLQADTTTMEMQLNPESLGKVLLTVSNKAGMMTANFTVQTEEARLALESQMYTLRETLEQKELKVDAVEVTVSNFEFTQEGGSSDDQKNLNQGDGRSRRFRVENQEEEEGEAVSAEEEAERVRRSVMRDNGSSIDFTA